MVYFASHGAPPPSVTVLAVDDDAGIRRALCRALRGDDWRVLTAASGDEALDLLGREPVDAVVADLVMPGLAGNELLHHVRYRDPAAARLLLTASPGDSRAWGALRAGDAEQVLAKPWEDEELRTAVAQALGRGHPGRGWRLREASPAVGR